jgi:hypothetical protein
MVYADLWRDDLPLSAAPRPSKTHSESLRLSTRSTEITATTIRPAAS